MHHTYEAIKVKYKGVAKQVPRTNARQQKSLNTLECLSFFSPTVSFMDPIDIIVHSVTEQFIVVAIDKEFILVNFHWLNSGNTALFIFQGEKQIP